MGRDRPPGTAARPAPVSIHAPAWGATYSRMGLDAEPPVSIHAPAWGATASIARDQGLKRSFNPRARMGRDLLSLRDITSALHVSIHAPAWGATDAAKGGVNNWNGFNPRARMGRDRTIAYDRAGDVLFQSTRPHGARRGTDRKRYREYCFNPRARMGRDRTRPV